MGKTELKSFVLIFKILHKEILKKEWLLFQVKKIVKI